MACVRQAQTALHLASRDGHTAVVETLLLNGADLEARDNHVGSSSCSYTCCIDIMYLTCEDIDYDLDFILQQMSHPFLAPPVGKPFSAFLSCSHTSNGALNSKSNLDAMANWSCMPIAEVS